MDRNEKNLELLSQAGILGITRPRNIGKRTSGTSETIIVEIMSQAPFCP